MQAEIVCIGTELLLGQIVDTNAAFMARELADLGIDLYHKTTVGDNLDRIVAALQLAWSRSDLLILSGGLGPTQDDLTREAVAGLLDEELVLNEEAWRQVQERFTKLKWHMSENNRRQAMFPKSAKVIPNLLGTAPCLLAVKEGHYLIALPGVPREFIGVWQAEVKPYLKSLLATENNPVLTSRMIRMVGIGESAMEEQVLDLIENQTNPTIAPYAGNSEVTLRITAKGYNEQSNRRLIDNTTSQIQERLGPYIYGYDSDNLETVIGRLLLSADWRLATAESCTGGLISHRITNVAGSSAYLLGGVNSYSNDLKINLLGVPAEIIAKFGAVSPETARAMVKGIRKLTGAEAGVAVTGIAGPGGGSPEKPVGLVYIAVELPDLIKVEERRFGSDRIGNKEATAQHALALLWQSLKQLGV